MTRNNTRIKYLWYISVFVFIYIWFSQVHPLVLFDADDWGLVSFARNALPDLDKWNPAKVFPEVLMSFACTVAAYTIYPITGDYIRSITIISSLVASSFITFYVYCLGNCIRRIFDFNSIKCIYVEALFLILHFLIFRQGDTGNTYLFYCEDLTCYYNYLFPALLNASMVMWLFGNKTQRTDKNYVKNGIVVLVIYLAIFSNLIDNIILAGYVAIEIIFDLLDAYKRKTGCRKFIKEQGSYLLILMCWCVCAVFEMLGGRAAIAGENGNSFAECIMQTIDNYMDLMMRMHKIFILFAIVITGITVFLMFLKKARRKWLDDLLIPTKILCLIVLMTVYAIIITAKVEASYIGRSEYVFGICFYILFFLMICLGYVIKNAERSLIAVPLMLFILLSFVNTNMKTFREPNQMNVSGNICYKMSYDLVEKVISADEAGKSAIELEVSNSGGVNNWPQAIYMGERISTALYKHGVTNNKIEITLIPSTKYNERYNLY